MMCPEPVNWSPFGTTVCENSTNDCDCTAGACCCCTGAITEEVLIISTPSIDCVWATLVKSSGFASSIYEGAAGLISATFWIEFSISRLNCTLLMRSWLGLISLSTGVVSKLISRWDGNTEYRWGGIVLKVLSFLIYSGTCWDPGITPGIVLPSVFEKVCCKASILVVSLASMAFPYISRRPVGELNQWNNLYQQIAIAKRALSSSCAPSVSPWSYLARTLHWARQSCTHQSHVFLHLIVKLEVSLGFTMRSK